MKKVKRKYTRHNKIEPIQNAPQSQTSIVKEESSIVDRVTGEIVVVKRFTEDDLPLSIQVQIERDIALRKRLNLPDDSKERKERAVRYFRGE